MVKISAKILTGGFVFLLMYLVPTLALLPMLQDDEGPRLAYAQSAQQSNSTPSSGPSPPHQEIDSTPIAAVIVIEKDREGKVTFVPNNVTIKVGEEILVLNNDSTTAQSLTNGESPDDPLAGKLFDTGPIPPKGFVEYVAANVSPGSYPFYSTSSTSTKGVLIITTE